MLPTNWQLANLNITCFINGSTLLAKSSVTIPCSNDLLTAVLIAGFLFYKASSNIIAADNTVANGFAIFNPVACG
jgi:hypothetical protein